MDTAGIIEAMYGEFASNGITGNETLIVINADGESIGGFLSTISVLVAADAQLPETVWVEREDGKRLFGVKALGNEEYDLVTVHAR